MAYSLSRSGVSYSLGMDFSATYSAWRNSIIGGGYQSPYGGSGTTTTAYGQQNFPTSAYGQTIPVVYGKARLPGAYIWAPEILVKTTTTGTVLLSTTTVTVRMSARIRFARPLVADSRWRLRKLWADGSLILDATTGYKKSGLSIREYDGYSTQGRDPTMVSEEGASNVSAHRGYLDIVIKNYNLGTAGAPPPAFEAEWVQDDSGSTDVDNFTGFVSNQIDSDPAPDWENGEFYGIGGGFLRRFDVGTKSEVYIVPLSGLSGVVEDNSVRYASSFNRIVLVDFVSGFSGGGFPTIVDPATGQVIAQADSIGPAGTRTNIVCSLTIGNAGIYITSAFSTGYVATCKFDADNIELMSLSGVDWDGRISVVECICVGEIRADEADIYLVGDDKLYKAVINSTGQFTAITELYTDADNLIYCLFHEGNVIVWNDNAEVMAISALGAVVWTTTVPYQITASASTRSLGAPDTHRLDGDLLFEEATTYNFTDLDDGSTTEIAKSSSTVGPYAYDGEGNWSVGTDLTGIIARRTAFNLAGDGTTRDLEDFLVALMVAGGFDASEITCENIDDQILGAVIDITGGVRDIARQVCDPYSIAIFERAGQIVFKRANTDGSFALDVTIGSSDVLDRGGQAITATKLNPQEKAAKYGLNHRDPDEVYQAKPQWGEIPSLPLPVAVTDIGIKADIPIIISSDTAKVLATKRIYRDAQQVHEFAMSLRAEHLKIEPETVAQFTYAGRLVTGRVLENTIHPNFTNTLSLTEFLTSTSVTIEGATGRPIEPEPVGTTASRYLHLDIPLQADTHDLGGDGFRQYHVLASNGQPIWSGAHLFRKDTTGSYVLQDTQVDDGLVGIALEVLPDVDIPYATEFDRTLNVAFPNNIDLPASLTYEEMLSQDENYFAIGQPGRWEIVQVQTITNNGDGTATLETFRRCLDQSEEYTGDHALGDYVVYLSGGNVRSLEYSIASLDDAFDFKAVGIGGSINAVPAVNRTVTGEAEKIPKPGNLKAVIDGADIDLSWTRRARIGGGIWMDDGEDEYTTPLGESLEQYVLRIKDAPGGAVLRTYTVNNATTKTYPAADITTDFGSLSAGDELTYDIRQVSGTGVVCPTRETTITL